MPRAHHRELLPVSPGGLVVRPFVLGTRGSGWHQHPEAEATLVLRGTMRARVGDGMAEVAAGEVLLVAGAIPHHAAAAAHTAAVLTVQLPPDLGLAGPGCGGLLHTLDRLWERAAAGLIAPLANPAGLDRRLRTTDLLGRLGAVLDLLCTVQAPTSRTVAGRPPAAGGDARLAAVLDYIGAHLAEPLPVGRVAALAGLGVPGFSRWFAAAAGETFRSHCARRRVERACRLLEEDPGAPLERVAAAAGFASLTALHRRFRAFAGCAPGAWRRRSET